MCGALENFFGVDGRHAAVVNRAVAKHARRANGRMANNFGER
jgi:hypothetical protein